MSTVPFKVLDEYRSPTQVRNGQLNQGQSPLALRKDMMNIASSPSFKARVPYDMDSAHDIGNSRPFSPTWQSTSLENASKDENLRHEIIGGVVSAADQTSQMQESEVKSPQPVRPLSSPLRPDRVLSRTPVGSPLRTPIQRRALINEDKENTSRSMKKAWNIEKEPRMAAIIHPNTTVTVDSTITNDAHSLSESFLEKAESALMRLDSTLTEETKTVVEVMKENAELQARISELIQDKERMATETRVLKAAMRDAVEGAAIKLAMSQSANKVALTALARQRDYLNEKLQSLEQQQKSVSEDVHDTPDAAPESHTVDASNVLDEAKSLMQASEKFIHALPQATDKKLSRAKSVQPLDSFPLSEKRQMKDLVTSLTLQVASLHRALANAEARTHEANTLRYTAERAATILSTLTSKYENFLSRISEHNVIAMNRSELQLPFELPRISNDLPTYKSHGVVDTQNERTLATELYNTSMEVAQGFVTGAIVNNDTQTFKMEDSPLNRDLTERLVEHQLEHAEKKHSDATATPMSPGSLFDASSPLMDVPLTPEQSAAIQSQFSVETHLTQSPSNSKNEADIPANGSKLFTSLDANPREFSSPFSTMSRDTDMMNLQSHFVSTSEFLGKIETLSNVLQATSALLQGKLDVLPIAFTPLEIEKMQWQDVSKDSSAPSESENGVITSGLRGVDSTASVWKDSLQSSLAGANISSETKENDMKQANGKSKKASTRRSSLLDFSSDGFFGKTGQADRHNEASCTLNGDKAKSLLITANATMQHMLRVLRETIQKNVSLQEITVSQKQEIDSLHSQLLVLNTNLSQVTAERQLTSEFVSEIVKEKDLVEQYNLGLNNTLGIAEHSLKSFTSSHIQFRDAMHSVWKDLSLACEQTFQLSQLLDGDAKGLFERIEAPLMRCTFQMQQAYNTNLQALDEQVKDSELLRLAAEKKEQDFKRIKEEHRLQLSQRLGQDLGHSFGYPGTPFLSSQMNLSMLQSPFSGTSRTDENILNPEEVTSFNEEIASDNNDSVASPELLGADILSPRMKDVPLLGDSMVATPGNTTLQNIAAHMIHAFSSPETRLLQQTFSRGVQYSPPVSDALSPSSGTAYSSTIGSPSSFLDAGATWTSRNTFYTPYSVRSKAFQTPMNRSDHLGRYHPSESMKTLSEWSTRRIIDLFVQENPGIADVNDSFESLLTMGNTWNKKSAAEKNVSFMSPDNPYAFKSNFSVESLQESIRRVQERQNELNSELSAVEEQGGTTEGSPAACMAPPATLGSCMTPSRLNFASSSTTDNGFFELSPANMDSGSTYADMIGTEGRIGLGYMPRSAPDSNEHTFRSTMGSTRTVASSASRASFLSRDDLQLGDTLRSCASVQSRMEELNRGEVNISLQSSAVGGLCEETIQCLVVSAAIGMTELVGSVPALNNIYREISTTDENTVNSTISCAKSAQALTVHSKTADNAVLKNVSNVHDKTTMRLQRKEADASKSTTFTRAEKEKKASKKNGKVTPAAPVDAWTSLENQKIPSMAPLKTLDERSRRILSRQSLLEAQGVQMDTLRGLHDLSKKLLVGVNKHTYIPFVEYTGIHESCWKQLQSSNAKQLAPCEENSASRNVESLHSAQCNAPGCPVAVSQAPKAPETQQSSLLPLLLSVYDSPKGKQPVLPVEFLSPEFAAALKAVEKVTIPTEILVLPSPPKQMKLGSTELFQEKSVEEAVAPLFTTTKDSSVVELEVAFSTVSDDIQPPAALPEAATEVLTNDEGEMETSEGSANQEESVEFPSQKGKRLTSDSVSLFLVDESVDVWSLEYGQRHTSQWKKHCIEAEEQLLGICKDVNETPEASLDSHVAVDDCSRMCTPVKSVDRAENEMDAPNSGYSSYYMGSVEALLNSQCSNCLENSNIHACTCYHADPTMFAQTTEDSYVAFQGKENETETSSSTVSKETVSGEIKASSPSTNTATKSAKKMHRRIREITYEWSIPEMPVCNCNPKNAKILKKRGVAHLSRFRKCGSCNIDICPTNSSSLVSKVIGKFNREAHRHCSICYVSFCLECNDHISEFPSEKLLLGASGSFSKIENTINENLFSDKNSSLDDKQQAVTNSSEVQKITLPAMCGSCAGNFLLQNNDVNKNTAVQKALWG